MNNIVIIDTHTHINHGSVFDTKVNETYAADLKTLCEIAKNANIEKMFCSTFSSVSSCEDVVEENEYMYRIAKENESIYQWVVIDPRNEKTFTQAGKMLKSYKCVGIKLHPVNHKYSLDEYGDKLFSFASKYNAIVQIHPETDADYIIPFANKYPNVIFIMAHMGSYDSTSYARAINNAINRNVYIDTSGIASWRNLIVEYTVKEAGSDRILFGTDTYAAGFQRGRIEYALISEQDKENILFNNAKTLFGF